MIIDKDGYIVLKNELDKTVRFFDFYTCKSLDRELELLTVKLYNILYELELKYIQYENKEIKK